MGVIRRYVSTNGTKILDICDDVIATNQDSYFNGDGYAIQLRGGVVTTNIYSTVTFTFEDSQLHIYNNAYDSRYPYYQALYMAKEDEGTNAEAWQAEILNSNNPDYVNRICYYGQGVAALKVPSGSASYNGGTHYVVNTHAQIATNIPVFENLEDAEAYVYASDEASRLRALSAAINYQEVPSVNPDKYMSAQLNLLRRRLLAKVRNGAST